MSLRFRSVIASLSGSGGSAVPLEALRRGGRLVGRAGARVIDAVLPPTCLACRQIVSDHGSLCADCFRGLHVIVPPFCDACGVPLQHEGQGVKEDLFCLCPRCADAALPFGRGRSAFLYDGGSKRLLLPFKHGDRPELARPIARHMARAGQELLDAADLLVPVPLHWRRLLRRRYNQAALLAAELSRLSGKPWLPNGLRRCRPTTSLGGLNPSQRASAVSGVFALHRRAAGAVHGRRILLVDDVLTTGATAGACAEVLLLAGAAGVDVLAAARVPDPQLREAERGNMPPPRAERLTGSRSDPN
ncbi:ComF family protein [Roseomonas elaeocarpi]|uniref:ComF family protein n=1 Tax=Roseomonas elaeocarpi TaxID=907779 RepID=A0ABV6JUR7_9PROT